MILNRRKLNPFFIIFMLAGAAFITADLTMNFAWKKGTFFVDNSAFLTALSGMLLLLLTFFYYLVKKTHFALMKKTHLKPAIRSFSWNAVYIYKKVHPFIGAAALPLIAVHGYLFFYRIYDFYTDILILSGAAAFVSFITAASFGIALFRNPHSLILRKLHRFSAVIAIVLIASHLAIGR